MIIKLRDASTDNKGTKDHMLIINNNSTIDALRPKIQEKLRRTNLDGLAFYSFDPKTNTQAERVGISSQLMSIKYPGDPHLLVIKEGEVYGATTPSSPPTTPQITKAPQTPKPTPPSPSPVVPVKKTKVTTSNASERLAELKAKMKMGAGTRSISPSPSPDHSDGQDDDRNRVVADSPREETKETVQQSSPEPPVQTQPPAPPVPRQAPQTPQTPQAPQAPPRLANKPPQIPQSPQQPPPPTSTAPKVPPRLPVEVVDETPKQTQKQDQRVPEEIGTEEGKGKQSETQEKDQVAQEVKRENIKEEKDSDEDEEGEPVFVDAAGLIEMAKDDKNDPVALYGDIVYTEPIISPEKPQIVLSFPKTSSKRRALDNQDSGNNDILISENTSTSCSYDHFEKGLYKVENGKRAVSYDDFQEQFREEKVSAKLNTYFNNLQSVKQQEYPQIYIYVHYNEDKLLVMKDTKSLPLVEAPKAALYPFTDIDIPQPPITQVYPFTRRMRGYSFVVAVESIGADLLIRDERPFKLRKYKKAILETEKLFDEKYKGGDSGKKGEKEEESLGRVILDAVRYDKYRKHVERHVLGKPPNTGEDPGFSFADFRRYSAWKSAEVKVDEGGAESVSPFSHPHRRKRESLIGCGVFASLFVVRDTPDDKAASGSARVGSDDNKNTIDKDVDTKDKRPNAGERRTRRTGATGTTGTKRKEQSLDTDTCVSPLTKVVGKQVLVDSHCPFLLPSIKMWDELTLDHIHEIESACNIVSERPRFKSATIGACINYLNRILHIPSTMAAQIYPHVSTVSQTLLTHQMLVCFDYEDVKSEGFDRACRRLKWVDLGEFEDAMLRVYSPGRYIQIVLSRADMSSEIQSVYGKLRLLSTRAALAPFLFPTRAFYWMLCGCPPPYYFVRTGKELTRSILSIFSPTSISRLEKMIEIPQVQGASLLRAVLYCICKKTAGETSLRLVEAIEKEVDECRAPMRESLKKRGIKRMAEHTPLGSFNIDALPQKMSSRTRIINALIGTICDSPQHVERATHGDVFDNSEDSFDTKMLEMLIGKCEKAMLPLPIELVSSLTMRDVGADTSSGGELPDANVNFDGLLGEAKNEAQTAARPNFVGAKRPSLFDEMEVFIRSIIHECTYNTNDEVNKLRVVADVKATVDRMIDVVETTHRMVDVTTLLVSKRHVNTMINRDEEELKAFRDRMITDATPKAIQIALDSLDENELLTHDEGLKVDGTPVIVSPTFVGSTIDHVPISPRLSPGSLSLLCDLPTPFALPIRTLSCTFGDIVCSIDSILETLDNTQALEDEVAEYKSLMRVVQSKHRTSEAKEMSISIAKERNQRGKASLSQQVASVLGASTQMPVITVTLDRLVEEADEIDAAETLKMQSQSLLEGRSIRPNSSKLIHESNAKKMRMLVNQDRNLKE